jgi:folate-binding protein YgfZ
MTGVVWTQGARPREVQGEGLRAIEGGAALVSRGNRARIVAVGADRARLLHAILTQDIENLGAGRGTVACLCNLQGRVVASLRLWARSEEIWMELEEAAAEAFLEAMQAHKIRERVWFVDRSADSSSLLLCGPEATSLLEGAGLPTPLGLNLEEASWRGHSFLVAGDLWTGRGDRTLLCERNAHEGLRAELLDLGFTDTDESALEAARIAAGIPRHLRDFGPAHLPLEGGMRATVSFTKGCYLGQEIVCRVDSLGAPPSTLWLFEAGSDSEPLPKPGTRLRDACQLTTASVVHRGEGAGLHLLAHVHKGGRGLPFDLDGRRWAPVRPAELRWAEGR